MRSGFLRTFLVLMLVLLAVPAIVQARSVHFFPCEDCHMAGVSPSSVTNNVCLTCHDVTSGSVLLNDATSASAGGRFMVGDASNRFNNNPAPGAQTSHNWGATDNNPAAGASAPLDRFFYGRQNYSGGTVACSRCHDPHGDMDTNPLLLKLPPDRTNPSTSQPYVAEDMCLDCHRDWDVSTHGLNTHPLGVDLATAAGNIPDANNDPADKYHDDPDNSMVANGGVALVNGKISCSTCHGIHHTDSNGDTIDAQGSVGAGDGLLLKHNGPGLEDVDTSICQTCHIYKLHGKDPLVQPGSMPLDCLDCHGGHEYDATDPNYFMLKKQVTVDTTNIKTGGGVEVINLNYGAGDVPDVNNRPLDFAGLCVNCHDLPGGHVPTWDCADCHNHENTSGSFGPGCGSCHGFPPTLDADGNSTPGGWANDPATGNRYDTSGVFKDESATAHATHAAGNGNYVFSCDKCHGVGAESAGHATHNTDTFQDVLNLAPGAVPALVSEGGNLNPTYAPGGAGSCSAVYCHSNGGPRGALPTTQAVSWEGGNGTITGTPGNCNACHGDTAANMTTKGNSARHNAHLNKFANNCSICHVNTASSNAALEPTAIGGEHVDGNNDIDFNTTLDLSPGNPLGSGTYLADGSCAIYCHTNGKGTAAVPAADWDLPATGACGTCHQYDNAGTATGTGAPLGNAHTAHVFDANGPGLACTTCHTHADGNSADHVDGALSYQAGLQAICNACHGADAGNNTPGDVDRQPIWTDATTVDCQTCHQGTRANIAGRTAPLKDAFTATGHGSVANFNTAYPAAPCEACHATTANHFNGVTDDIMLSGGAAADDAFCKTCHGGNNSHFSDLATPGGGSTDGDSCAACHEPHGEGMNTNVDRMLIVGAAFDSSDITTFVNTSRTGVCQTCHVKTDGAGGGIKYYNQTDVPDGSSHNAGAKCTGCHSHGSSPEAFAAGAGTNCGDCHGYPPADVNGVHASHTWVDDGDLANPNEDFSDCAFCHTGADLYTYDRAADAASGTPGRENHGVSPASQAATLLASVGYDGTSCASACHTSTPADGAWADANGLNCDSCHANPPAGDNHSKHIAASIGCDTCHVAVPTDTTHIDDFDLVADSDAVALADKADAVNSEATVAVSTWDPVLNTCSNTACHNPTSGGTKLADWDTSTSSCTLCHDHDVASTSPMASGSHAQHVNNAALIGDLFACVDCHGDTTTGETDMAHRSGAIEFTTGVAGMNYEGVGNTCSTTTCHHDDGTIRQTPDWFAGPVADPCVLCHRSNAGADPVPTRGDHTGHWQDAQRITDGLECASCHVNTVNPGTLTIIPTASGGKHLDGSQVDAIPAGNAAQFLGADVAFTYNSVANPSTCATTSCHGTSTTRDWSAPSGCADCHGNLADKGAVHTAHIEITTSIQDDRSECVVCHGAQVNNYGLSGGGDPAHGTGGPTDFATGISNTTCANACHNSDGTDGFWTDANGLNCDACHGEPPADQRHTKHVTDSGMACTDCHGTVDTAGTHPLTHNHAKDIIGAPGITDAESLQTRGNMANYTGVGTDDSINPNGQDIAVSDAAWNAGGPNTFTDSAVTNDAGNSCSNIMCHNPSDDPATSADWDVANAVGCAFCHGDDGTVAVMTSGSHQRHLEATGTYGLTIDCDRCHADNVSNSHFMTSNPTAVNGQVQFGGSVIAAAGTGNSQYAGDIALPNDGVAAALQYGSCGTSACHNNGQGGAPVAPAYEWATVVGTGCQTCHTDPPSTGRHATHLGTTVNYGPYAGVASTTCNDCHAANATLTMAGQAAHINGVINFADGTNTNSGDINTDSGAGRVAQCDNCHGGVGDADTAKTQWDTIARLTCESCHDGSFANSQADGLGLDAPDNSSNYVASGHGGLGGSSPVCTGCHSDTSAHISGTANDTNRLVDRSGNSYDTIGQRNAWCNDCHGTTMNGHYDTGDGTPAGSSDSGLYCNICHNPHGEAGGQDAMIKDVVQGNSVTGFNSRLTRGDYSNPAGTGYDGICQVCHDPTSVDHFNTGAENTGHNSGVCTSCHAHDDTPAFAPSGCNGCHGGGTSGATASNYWPDSAVVAGENTAGEHVKHMEQLSLRQYGLTLIGLLDDAGSDTKQKALCAFCHDTPGADTDHGGALPAEVNSMFPLWDGGTADNANYNAGADTCSSVNCHNGKTTTDNTYGWYDGATSDCTMCHTAGDVGANPTTGLHVTSAAGVTTHDDGLTGNGCAECHTAPAMTQASSHINGTYVAEGGGNNDRFLNNTNFTYTEAPVNTSTCTANCHLDSNNWERQWSTDADSAVTTLGSNRCDVCHGQLNGWRTGLSVDHDLLKVNDGTHSDCTQCHVAPNGPYVFASMHEDGNIQVNGNVSMNYNTTGGSCNVTACHGATPTRGLGASTIFPEDLLNGPDVTCNSCHSSTGGFAANQFAHTQHVSRAASSSADYGDTTIYSTATGYSFGCGTCHPTNANFATMHNNGVVNLTMNNTHGGAIKPLNNIANDTGGYSQSETVAGNGGSTTCSAAYCHSDGDGGFQTTPDWYGGSFPTPQADGTNDYCGNCHGNQPTTSSHAKHVIGIHHDDIYTGTTDLLAAAGGSGTGAGHGDVATALTINCNACHADTLNQWRNDHNTACRSCHAGEGNQVTSSDIDLKMNFHVNGVKDVKFASVDPVRSKAQIRELTPGEPELNDNWQRVNGYKLGVDSHDATKTSPPLNTATMWTGSNCTVACHNGNTIAWGATGISCNACHTQLPQ